MLTFGQADPQLVGQLQHQAPGGDVVELALGKAAVTEEHDVRFGDDPSTVWTEAEISDEAIKPYRPYSKAVGIFAIRDLQMRQAKQLLSVIRHGLPAGGELHLIEFAASKAADATVGDLLRKAGFKVVERMSAVPTLLGVLELYKALKQPTFHAEGP